MVKPRGSEKLAKARCGMLYVNSKMKLYTVMFDALRDLEAALRAHKFHTENLISLKGCDVCRVWILLQDVHYPLVG